MQAARFDRNTGPWEAGPSLESYLGDLLSLRTPLGMRRPRIDESVDHAAVLSSGTMRRNLGGSPLARRDEHEGCDPWSLNIKSVLAPSLSVKSPDLLGVDRLPRNLISGVLCCAAAACRNTLVAFIAGLRRDARRSVGNGYLCTVDLYPHKKSSGLWDELPIASANPTETLGSIEIQLYHLRVESYSMIQSCTEPA